MNVTVEVCVECKDAIKILIKAPNYKPLANPKACEKCKQKTVEKSYHAICNNCAVKEHICAKCMEILKDDDCIQSPIATTDKEHQKFKKEIDKLIKTLPERKRNKFLRFMRRGKKVKTKILKASEAAATVKVPESSSNKQPKEKISANDSKTFQASTATSCTIDSDEQHQKTIIIRRIPHSKETLLKKIEELKVLEEVDETDETDETESEFE